MKAYKRGFESAIRMNDGEVLDLIFTNMLILAKDTHCLAEMPRYWKQYLKFKRTRRSVFLTTTSCFTWLLSLCRSGNLLLALGSSNNKLSYYSQ